MRGVDISENFIYGGPFTSLSLAAGTPFSAPQTAGNRNVVLVQWVDSMGPGGSIPSVVDTLGNAYTMRGGVSYTPGPGFTYAHAAFECIGIKGGANAVTIEWSLVGGVSTASFTAGACREYEGTSSAPSYHYSAASASTSGPGEVSITPEAIGDFLVCLAGLTNGTTTGALNTLVGTILVGGSPGPDSLVDEYESTSLAAHAVGCTLSGGNWSATGLAVPSAAPDAMFFGTP